MNCLLLEEEFLKAPFGMKIPESLKLILRQKHSKDVIPCHILLKSWI
jgi:hypothetical protein